ncbi:MAG: TRAP transporter substrate-binding protein DctP [Bacteroidota bacterium]
MTKRFIKIIFFTQLLISLLLSTALSQQYIIKFASIAPDGSTWMNVMKEYDAAIRKESGGRVGFRMYPSGVQGDEKTVIRKIGVGQLHAAGFTGVGLGEIASKERILDTPFLIRSSEEADNLYQVFDQELQQAFVDGGYVLLGWSEVGFVYVFSNSPIMKQDDIKQIKMWVWDGDPVAETAFRALDLRPIPLSFDNVRTSLQTGLVNAFYTTPYAAIALQWYTQAKFMVDYPLTCSSGAVLLSKKYYDTMSKDLQEILIRNGRIYMKKLTDAGRLDNKNSLLELKKRGITFTEANDKEVQEYMAAGLRARRMLVGKMYDEDFMNRVEKAADDFRKGEKKK